MSQLFLSRLLGTQNSTRESSRVEKTSATLKLAKRSTVLLPDPRANFRSVCNGWKFLLKLFLPRRSRWVSHRARRTDDNGETYICIGLYVYAGEMIFASQCAPVTAHAARFRAPDGRSLNLLDGSVHYRSHTHRFTSPFLSHGRNDA